LQIDVFHSDESLSDDYTLMDVAYIYTWRRVSHALAHSVYLASHNCTPKFDKIGLL